MDARPRRMASPATVPQRATRDRLRRVLQPDARREDPQGRARQGDRRARRDATVRRRRGATRLSPRRLDPYRVRADRRARRLAAVPAGGARCVPRPDPERELKRTAPPSRRDHQDRQLARPSAAGRGRLAPTQPDTAERHPRTQTRRQAPRCPSPGRAERPSAPRTLARARVPRQAPHDRRGRGRPRTRRALLGARDDGVDAWSTARRGERTDETTRGATRENTVSSPTRPRSTPENGSAPHFAHTVMRHQPAYMSRDKDVDDSRCAPPAEPTPQTAGRPPLPLTRPNPYECCIYERQVGDGA